MAQKPMEPRAKAVGAIIKHRRQMEQRLSMAAVASAGGPSPATQVQWEKGVIPLQTQPGVKPRYEKALGWPEGHIDALLRGEIPLPAGVEVVEQESEPSDVYADISAELKRMFSIMPALQTQADRLASPELSRTVEQLTRAQNRIMLQLLATPGPPPGAQITDRTSETQLGDGGSSNSGE